MRATANPPSLAGISAAVWDQTTTGHIVVGTFGSTLYYAYADTTALRADYARRTPYTYGPTNLAAGATYVPVTGTVVTLAVLDGAAAQEFHVMHGTITAMSNDAGSGLTDGYAGMLYCDGTDAGIKNSSGGGLNLLIEGFTI